MSRAAVSCGSSTSAELSPTVVRVREEATNGGYGPLLVTGDLCDLRTRGHVQLAEDVLLLDVSGSRVVLVCFNTFSGGREFPTAGARPVSYRW